MHSKFYIPQVFHFNSTSITLYGPSTLGPNFIIFHTILINIPSNRMYDTTTLITFTPYICSIVPLHALHHKSTLTPCKIHIHSTYIPFIHVILAPYLLHYARPL
jgi:hypothetical protein